jgi:hypothetical protein
MTECGQNGDGLNGGRTVQYTIFGPFIYNLAPPTWRALPLDPSPP